MIKGFPSTVPCLDFCCQQLQNRLNDPAPAGRSARVCLHRELELWDCPHLGALIQGAMCRHRSQNLSPGPEPQQHSGTRVLLQAPRSGVAPGSQEARGTAGIPALPGAPPALFSGGNAKLGSAGGLHCCFTKLQQEREKWQSVNKFV